VRIFNRTLFERNVAPEGWGSSFYLSENGTLQYTLPAPPGRWLTIRQDITLKLDMGFEDLEFPYPCSAGIIGGIVPEEQMGPGCSRPW
jgi:hypothetical protein